jgi:hypothetical protein
MLAVTLGVDVAAGAVLYRLSSSGVASVVLSVSLALAAAWTGLVIGYRRALARAIPYDTLPRPSRRLLRRALWTGRLPDGVDVAALAAQLTRTRSASRWTPLVGAGLAVQQVTLALQDAHGALRDLEYVGAAAGIGLMVAALWLRWTARKLELRLGVASSPSA